MLHTRVGDEQGIIQAPQVEVDVGDWAGVSCGQRVELSPVHSIEVDVEITVRSKQLAKQSNYSQSNQSTPNVHNYRCDYVSSHNNCTIINPTADVGELSHQVIL